MIKSKSKFVTSSKIMFVGSIVIALIGVAFLANNILLFRNLVDNYLAQGYPSSEVLTQLIPSQLLPGIFEPIAVYGGIASILFCASIINQKLSTMLAINVINETGEILQKDSLTEEVFDLETAEEIDEEEIIKSQQSLVS